MATEKSKTTSKSSGGGGSKGRSELPDSAFAFTKARKEPLTDAKHVRNAIARFDQVEGVNDSERDAAWRKIKAAAKKHGVEVSEKSWRELTKGGGSKSG